MKRRFLGIAMALLLLFAFFPTAALADDSFRYEVTLEDFSDANGSIKYSTDNINFYTMDSTAVLTWASAVKDSNTDYSIEIASETDVYIKCTPNSGYTVCSSGDNRTIFGEADATYTFKLAEDAPERVSFVANGDVDSAISTGTSYNPNYTTTELDDAIKSLGLTVDSLFYATDAYGNILDDEVTIARGGSYFLRFKVANAAKALMNQGELSYYPPTTYTDLGQLFGNVGWNLETIDGVIEYTNEEPSSDNNWSGGIHIDTLANCGKTIYLDFYISPRVNVGAGDFLTVNWGTMSEDYVIKKVIKVTVEDSENISSTAGGVSVTMTKPIPEGYDLTVTPLDSNTLSEKDGYSSGNVENYGVDFTMKDGTAEYPVTNNFVQVAMPVPKAMEGCAEYAVSYLDPNTDTIKSVAAATVENGELSFTTTHFSSLIITGSGGTMIEDILYSNLDAAAAAAQKNDVIVMQVDGTLTQSTNHVAGVTIDKNDHMLKIAGGSHAFVVTAEDLAPGCSVSESNGVYTVTCGGTHTVSFHSNNGSSVAPVIVTCGDAAVQPADPTRNGYVFRGWYTDSGLTTQYDFTALVTNDFNLYAKWTQEVSGGGSSTNITVPAFSDEGSVNVSATVSGSMATISVTDAQLNQITGSNDNIGTVKVDVSSLKVEEAVIPAKLVTAAADASGSNGLEVEFSAGSVALDKTALESVGNNSITVSVADVKITELTVAQKEALGDKADAAIIVDVNVLVNGVGVSEFNGGLITVNVPFTPKAGEDTSKQIVWYLADDGSIEPMDGKYNAKTKCYEFTTTHLSTYVLTSFPFTDVAADSYYYNAASWAVANKITEGTTATTFSPTAICTRAQMVTFLWRALGSPEPTNATCQFTDLSADAYYYKAVVWAAEKGYTEGTSDVTFSPDDTVTRAQVVTFEWRAAGKIAATANSFADVASGTYYENAVMWAVEQKITDGTSSTTFSPADLCTRAQIVTFLYRYIAK